MVSRRGAVLAALGQARQGVRQRRLRVVLNGVGIVLAAAMLTAAIVISDGLGDGFDRAAAKADLPDIIVRFDAQPARRVATRLAALPDLAAYATRQEFTNVAIDAGGEGRGDAIAEVIGAGRRGYAVVAGRDVRPRGAEVVVEKGYADARHLRLGGQIFVRGLGAETVVGFGEAPDDVGFPLAKPRFYLAQAALDAQFGIQRQPQVNVAEIWLRDRRYLNEVLVQARATSFGLHNLRFVTRSGLRVLLDQAAGVVIDLLVALSVIALATAGTMLAASARAEVQRRLPAIGVRRALGASRGHEALSQALETLLVAAPAAAIGVALGALVTVGPDDRLLELLNEPPPGAELIVPLLAGWLVAVAIPVAGAVWPAWRASGQPPVALMQGGDLSARSARAFPGMGLPRLARSGIATLGARLVSARRGRLVTLVSTLGLSAGFVLLLLALASALTTLETDPRALGKRYELTASLPPAGAARVRRIPGVSAAAPRYELTAADSFALGETVDVIAYPGDHTVFEAPPLLSGRRLRGRGEAEVGAGLAQALGLGVGSTLALALPAGGELRLRVAGVVSSLDHDGRVAYVPAAALLAAGPPPPSQIAVQTRPSAIPSVSAALVAIGASPATATGATARGAPLISTLRTILVSVAIVDGLVCLYALIQACALTVQERRRAIAALRACGGDGAAVRRLLMGAALALIVPAAIVGLLLERLLFAPALTQLAASYATLPLGSGAAQPLAVGAGLMVAAVVAVSWVAASVVRQPVVHGIAG